MADTHLYLATPTRTLPPLQGGGPRLRCFFRPWHRSNLYESPGQSRKITFLITKSLTGGDLISGEKFLGAEAFAAWALEFENFQRADAAPDN